MEKEPLLPFLSSRISQIQQPSQPITLSSLPENEQVSLLSPSELKDRLIFGPSLNPDDSPACSSPSAALIEALAISLSSPRPSSPSTSDHFQRTQQIPQPWATDSNSNTSLRKKLLHRSKTAPAMSTINDVQRGKKLDQPQIQSPSIVRQGVVLLVIYLSLGILIYWCFRDQFAGSDTFAVVDAMYFCIVTMCTIGYGDITPDSTATKLFSILFVLVGFGFVDILLSGMVSYVLDLQESYLLRTVETGKKTHENGRSLIVDVKKGRMRIRMKVALALLVVVICIGVGSGVMHYVERLGWVDSFYLSVMSVTTVGYGDRAFRTLPGRIFASIWLLVSTLAVARAFLYLAEARVDKRHRMMAKWVLGQDMTVAQFLAADMDHNGFVSKSEYVIYKLKEMGKVTEKDILLICRKFDELDSGRCGKITLTDLMEPRSEQGP